MNTARTLEKKKQLNMLWFELIAEKWERMCSFGNYDVCKNGFKILKKAEEDALGANFPVARVVSDNHII